MPNQQRADLEDEVRRNFARAVRERVGFSDDQMAKLGPITRKFEEQRRQAQMDERDARTKLQGLVMVGAESDSVRIKQFIAQLNEVHRRRFQIDEAEQKDLAGIMTPLQLAKFLGIQEQVRRRLEQMRPFPGGPPDGMARGGGRPPEDQFGAGQARDSATVRLAVLPLRGTINIDGIERGKGRIALYLPFGWHRVTFSADGCDSVQDSILVGRGYAPPMMKSLTSKTADCK